MLKPARANSCTVASCSEPFGMPSLSFIVSPLIQHEDISSLLSFVSLVLTQRSKAGSSSGVAHVAVAEALHLQQHGIVVAVDEHVDDFELVAGGLALHPQLVARAAEEGGEAGAARFRERDVVHEADHQDLRRVGVLDDGGNQSVEFGVVHKKAAENKKPRRWRGASRSVPSSEFSVLSSETGSRPSRGLGAVVEMVTRVMVSGEHRTARVCDRDFACQRRRRAGVRDAVACSGVSASRAIITSVDLTIASASSPRRSFSSSTASRVMTAVSV